jgi:hypothetical protein
MSTQTIEQPGRRPLGLVWRQAVSALLVAVAIAGNVTRAQAKPTLAHLRDHAYSICGFMFISAAAFTHSVFTGLLVTGVLFFVYEFKVADDGNS